MEQENGWYEDKHGIETRRPRLMRVKERVSYVRGNIFPKYGQGLTAFLISNDSWNKTDRTQRREPDEALGSLHSHSAARVLEAGSRKPVVDDFGLKLVEGLEQLTRKIDVAMFIRGGRLSVEAKTVVAFEKTRWSQKRRLRSLFAFSLILALQVRIHFWLSVGIYFRPGQKWL